jgi:signal transduction histidine kinase
MPPMRATNSLARRVRPPRGGAATALWLAAGSALAADAGPSTIGPWIFASVALVLVAVASFAAGRRAGPGDGAAGGPPATARARPESSTDGASILQSQFSALGADSRPMLLWRSGCALQAGTATGSAASANAAPGAGLELVDANAAARALFALPPTLPCPGVEVACLLPAAARQLLGGEVVAAGSAWWCLRDDPGGVVLLLGPPPEEAAGDGSRDEATLAYAVSHDLRAPIRVVEGFARIVKEDYGRVLDRVGLDHLERVLAAAARMNLMIDAVLGLARLGSQPLARQTVDLSQLAGFVIDDLRRHAPERQVEVSIEPGLSARGDPTLLRVVLENLLGNAWKYSAGVTVARIEFSRDPGQGAGTFRVRDNGAGFDMRFSDRLFGLFQRLHSSKDFAGTGVGLASVRRVVQRHGGRIWAEAAPGKGASFHFTLGP